MSLPHETLSATILEAAFEVSNELGAGFVGSVYEQALFVALRDKGVCSERQVAIKVFFRGELAGKGIKDEKQPGPPFPLTTK